MVERLPIDLRELRSRNGNEAGISLTENHQGTIARRHWRATEHHDSSAPPVRQAIAHVEVHPLDDASRWRGDDDRKLALLAIAPHSHRDATRRLEQPR